MPLRIVQNDITRMETDAIVNAANSALAMGGGVCGAIFAAAGEREMTEACQKIGRCSVGGSVITDGFRLPAKYVIHAVGPIWHGGTAEEAELLRNCYRSALTLASVKGLTSIAFPLISSGIYGYPKAEALRIALDTIAAFLMETESETELLVYLVVFDRSAVQLSAALTDRLEQWLDTASMASRQEGRREERLMQLRLEEEQAYCDCNASDGMVFAASSVAPTEPRPKPAGKPRPASPQGKNAIFSAKHASHAAWEGFTPSPGETFSEQLLRRIDERGMTDVETYKRANIDRRLFSKIRSRKDYLPSRRTAIALAVALRLDLAETRELLRAAGYALSDANRFDLIVRFFIEEGDFDVYRINEALFYYGEPLLGA